MRNRGDSFDRRTLFKRGAALAGGALACGFVETGCSSETAARSATDNSAASLIVASDSNAVVETTSGKVRGFTRNGIHTFKGIPYAASTAEAGRFLPPRKPEPWQGIRSSMYYGPTCPQAPRTGWLNDENAFLFQWDDGQPGED